MLAFKKNKCLPEECKKEDLCKLAVQQNGWALPIYLKNKCKCLLIKSKLNV
jgi:hypothetical protein